MHVASVPDIIDFPLSDMISFRLSGANPVNPPIIIPKLPKGATPYGPEVEKLKPHAI